MVFEFVAKKARKREETMRMKPETSVNSCFEMVSSPESKHFDRSAYGRMSSGSDPFYAVEAIFTYTGRACSWESRGIKSPPQKGTKRDKQLNINHLNCFCA